MRKRERPQRPRKQKRRVKEGAYAIRRYKNPKEFEYLQDNNRWGERETRRRFFDRETAEKQAKAYNKVGVHARVVPYGNKEE
jgi:hypothetical protein